MPNSFDYSPLGEPLRAKIEKILVGFPQLEFSRPSNTPWVTTKITEQIKSYRKPVPENGIHKKHERRGTKIGSKNTTF